MIFEEILGKLSVIDIVGLISLPVAYFAYVTYSIAKQASEVAFALARRVNALEEAGGRT